MADWNTNITEEFRANEGRVGGPFEGHPMLLLHHTGAKSSTERVNPLAYQALGDGAVAVFASTDPHSAWSCSSARRCAHSSRVLTWGKGSSGTATPSARQIGSHPSRACQSSSRDGGTVERTSALWRS